MSNVLIRIRLMFISSTLLVFNTSVTCQSVIKLIEGKRAHLEFQYQCNASEVTLQHGYKAPLYRSINPQSIPLAPYPEERYKVENRVTLNGCSIYLTISPLQRNDAGTYITQVYKGGDVLPDMQRIGLNVDYPPGKALCERREGSQVGEWGLLHCTAAVGSLSGQFECYQRDERLPPYTTRIRNERILEQTIWVRLSHPVFCCTSTQELPTDQCECKDFVWIPSNYRKSKRIIEPCPVTTALQDITSQITENKLELEDRMLSHQHSPSGKGKETSSLVTLTETNPIMSQRYIGETVSQLLKWVYGMAAGLFILIILCLVICMKLCINSPLNKKKHIYDCQKNGQAIV